MTIQRTALTMLAIGGAVGTIGRAALAVANPLERQDLGGSVIPAPLVGAAMALFAYPASVLLIRAPIATGEAPDAVDPGAAPHPVHP